MNHPIEEMNKNQEEFLKALPEGERADHAQLFRIGNAEYCYHHRAQDFEPSQEDFQEWIDGLPNQVRSDMLTKGFEGCKRVLSFTRYVNEKNDNGMEQWMKEKLSNEDFVAYISGKPTGKNGMT